MKEKDRQKLEKVADALDLSMTATFRRALSEMHEKLGLNNRDLVQLKN